jgi:hypothetical protein
VTALSIPLFAFFTVLTVLLLSAALRRLMGMRLSPLRTLIAALIGWSSRCAGRGPSASRAPTNPHPGNILLLDDGHPGLLDWGSVGHIDAGLRGALQRLLLGGPALTSVSLYSFFGYCLVIAAILAVRVLVQVFRPSAE